MKKTLTQSLIFLLTFTFLFGTVNSIAPKTIHAQAPNCSENTSDEDYERCIQNSTGGNSLSKLLNPLNWVTGALGAMATAMLTVLSGLTAITGIFLNYIIDYTIVNMSDNYRDIGAIETAWSTVRDVANMGFIFILLYASIQMILGIGKNTRELIVNIIIAAILINFSLFFTQIVIDASNILALVFYKAIVPEVAGSNILNTGLSNALMNPLKLQTIWEASTIGGFNGPRLLTIGVLGSVVTLIAAFVFAAISLMLIIRYVVLILVLILSPIAVLGGILPSIDSYAKQWRSALFGQAFFAPVYMFLTWITISIFQSMPAGSGNFAEALAGTADGTGTVKYSADSVSIILNFAVIITFLIATLILSKKVSDSAGFGINKLTSKALGTAGGATLGLAARAGRGTIGRFGAGIASSERFKDAVAAGGATGMAARLAMAAGEKTAKSSMDLRGTSFGDYLEAGKPKKGASFASDEKTRQDAAIKRAKSLKPRAGAVEATNERIKATNTELATAKGRAEQEFNADNTRSAALRNAENEYNEAKKEADKTKSLGDTNEQIDARKTRFEEAEVKLRAEREKREQFVTARTTRESQTYEEAKEKREKMNNRSENYAKQQETDILGTRGVGGELSSGIEGWATKVRDKGGVAGKWTAGVLDVAARTVGLRQEERTARAEAVRKSTKEKSDEQKALDAVAEIAKKKLKDEQETSNDGEQKEPKKE